MVLSFFAVLFNVYRLFNNHGNTYLIKQYCFINRENLIWFNQMLQKNTTYFVYNLRLIKLRQRSAKKY